MLITELKETCFFHVLKKRRRKYKSSVQLDAIEIVLHFSPQTNIDYHFVQVSNSPLYVNKPYKYLTSM